MMERCVFHQLAQRPGRNVQADTTALRELLQNCSFRDLTEEMIRDQLIENRNISRIRERLLMEPDTHIS